MPERQTPNVYFNEPPTPYTLPTATETSVIPNWVPILLGIAILSLAFISVYAISAFKDTRKVKKDETD